MRAYERAGAHALVCPSVCLSVCMYICMYVYIFVCVFLYMHACACGRLCVCIYVCPLLFSNSNLLHLESNIYVGLLVYMRTHARTDIVTDVYIHTHTKRTDTHTSTHIHVCTHVPTRRHTFVPIHTRAGGIQCRPAIDQGLYCLLLQ